MDSRFLQDICTISRPSIVTRDLQQVQDLEVVGVNISCSVVTHKSTFENGEYGMTRQEAGSNFATKRSEDTRIVFKVGTDVQMGDVVEVNNLKKYKISDVEPQSFIS